MLAAENRLRDSDTFRRTVRAGRRAGGGALVVHVLVDEAQASQAPAPRVGLVVSKAVGNAVVRNRVKRRLRSLVRNVLSDLPSSATVVVRALPAASMMDSAELREELTRCLGRVCRSASAASARTGAAS